MLAWLLGCGESRRTLETADAGPSEPEDSGAAGASSREPVDSGVPIEVPTLACSKLTFGIDATNAAVIVDPSGVTIEPLQLPDYPEPPLPGPDDSSDEPDPVTWDRSELPAGACIFRLHGVDASCYPFGGVIFTSSCGTIESGGPKVAPGSFYERFGCEGPAPGCPSAEAGYNSPGYWWYLVDRGGAADLVICAPECAYSFKYGPACVVLSPDHGGACD